jgi:hypothetical protein
MGCSYPAMSFPIAERPIRMSPAAPAEVVLLGPGDVEVARWPLEDGVPVDLDLVDELARLALAARRSGWSLRISGLREDLADLLRLTGLSGALAADV